MSKNTQKKTFADLTNEDYEIFLEYSDLHVEQIKEIFDKLHVAHPNGKLTREEFALFYKSIDCDSCKLKNYQQFTDLLFKSFDSDNDNSLTVIEILLGFALTKKGNIDKKLDYAFRLYDVNNDNSLSKDEIKTGFKGMFIMSGIDPNEFVLELHTNNKIKKLDVNQDGKITRDEFKEAIMKSKKAGEGLFFM